MDVKTRDEPIHRHILHFFVAISVFIAIFFVLHIGVMPANPIQELHNFL